MTGGGVRSRELGDRLERLKVASGRSYESIGRKIHLSKSAVHRYCTGASVPREFGVVERIALACGANRDEMTQLHRLWLRTQTLSAGQAVISAVEAVPLPPAVPPRSGWRERFWRRRVVVLASLTMTALLAVVLVSSTSGTDPGASARRPAEQWINGPAWTLPSLPVPSSLFGVTINSATGAMPAFRVGAVRFWDGGTRWSEIQRQRGHFDWSVPDRLVKGAENASLPSLFVFGSTPRWASAGGQTGPYPDGTPTPPTDLADWDLFVRSVATATRAGSRRTSCGCWPTTAGSTRAAWRTWSR